MKRQLPKMKGGFITGWERAYLLKLLQLSIDYPTESRPTLIAMREILLNLREQNSHKISEEHKARLKEGREKYLKQQREQHGDS